ncbi:hypothetical protein SF83666_b59050 (plasmid) [Sinorhizobium fredii CCBAU 83666]|nr:hypothetical protein SF83666_b59050 [Sinorhizobium fredii CCBAU 83666]
MTCAVAKFWRAALLALRLTNMLRFRNFAPKAISVDVGMR